MLIITSGVAGMNEAAVLNLYTLGLIGSIGNTFMSRELVIIVCIDDCQVYLDTKVHYNLRN